jgi:hypothetical protein
MRPGTRMNAWRFERVLDVIVIVQSARAAGLRYVDAVALAAQELNMSSKNVERLIVGIREPIDGLRLLSKTEVHSLMDKRKRA